MSDPHALPDPRRAVRATGARPSAYTLVLNALPLVHVLGGIAAIAALDGWAGRAAAAAGWIYLLPPVAARIALAVAGGCEGSGLEQSARAYKAWWFATQMQVLFNRLPALEEALRLVPGLYALWLRSWGARVSPRVYWAAGTMVTDRMLVDVGDDVVVGTRAVLASHLAYRDEHGELRVTVARVRIGDSVLIGAYAGIGPGCTVEAGSEVPAAAFLRPFTDWRRDRPLRTPRPRGHA